jgi:plastocyanin
MRAQPTVAACAVVLALVLGGGVLAGCGKPKSGAELGPTTSLDFKAKATVTIDEDGVSPDKLTVTAGTTVTFRNDGKEPHRLSSKLFDTGRLEPGDETTIFFDATGPTVLRDADTPKHAITVVVQPAS